MQRTVVIRRVIFVEAGFDDLIDEPPVDPFIEMGRLHPEEKKSQESGESDDEPGHPLAFRQCPSAGIERIADDRKIRQRYRVVASSCCGYFSHHRDQGSQRLTTPDLRFRWTQSDG